METPQPTPKVYPALTKKELCTKYGVTYARLQSWLSDVPNLGHYKGGMFTPRQTAIIFNHLGDPAPPI